MRRLLLRSERPWMKAAFVLFGQTRYEQHICELQQRLEAANVAAELDGHSAQRHPIQEELQRVKAGHQERERALQDEIEALQQQQLKHKVGILIPGIAAHVHSRKLMFHLQTRWSPGPRQQQAEAAFGRRLERLNKELSAKTRTIQELSRSVERLQKEKRSTPAAFSRQPEAEKHKTERQQPPAAAVPPSCSPAAEESFPAAAYQKTYRPTVFTGPAAAQGSSQADRPSSSSAPLPDTRISDVLPENEALRQRLELLALHGKQEKEAFMVEVAQAREQLLR